MGLITGLLTLPLAPVRGRDQGNPGPRGRSYDRRMSVGPAGARPTGHEVLEAVLQVRGGVLQVLAWQRARPPGRAKPMIMTWM